LASALRAVVSGPGSQAGSRKTAARVVKIKRACERVIGRNRFSMGYLVDNGESQRAILAALRSMRLCLKFQSLKFQYLKYTKGHNTE
jgi:hypothetical protein